MTVQPNFPIHEMAGPIVFSADMPVLERMAASGRNVSRFGDEVWDLSPLMDEPTSHPVTLHFAVIPETFRDPIKQMMYCLINRPLPRGMLHRSTSAADEPGPVTYRKHLYEAITFVRVLAENQIGRLCDAGDTEFQMYREQLEARTRSDPNVVNQHSFYITRLSLYREYLPVEDCIPMPPWERRSARRRKRDHGDASPVNRTPPIHKATMDLVLTWGLRWVEDFSGDILRAAAARETMLASIPQKSLPGDRAKAIERLEQILRAKRPLPGVSLAGRGGRDVGVARTYLAAKLGVTVGMIQMCLEISPYRDMPVRIGAPIDDIAIEGRVDGEPWVESIDFYEVDTLVRHLASACLITTAYLSGMRGKEVRALERGCCRHIEAGRDSPERFEVWGRVFKGVRDSRGKAIPEGRVRDHPWAGVEEVQTALSVAELLHPHNLIFCGSLFAPDGKGRSDRIVQTVPMNNGFDRLIERCNAMAVRFGLPEIPPDPNGRITIRRFRQTIARDIAEAEEAGENVLMALNRQFDHRTMAQTMAYMGSEGEGAKLLEAQRLLAEHSHQHARAKALDEGLTVSGRAKEHFITRVARACPPFPGHGPDEARIQPAAQGRAMARPRRPQADVGLRVRPQEGAVSCCRFPTPMTGPGWSTASPSAPTLHTTTTT